MKKATPKTKYQGMNGTTQTRGSNPGLGRSQGGPKQMSTPVTYHHGVNTKISKKNISLD